MANRGKYRFKKQILKQVVETQKVRKNAIKRKNKRIGRRDDIDGRK